MEARADGGAVGARRRPCRTAGAPAQIRRPRLCTAAPRTRSTSAALPPSRWPEAAAPWLAQPHRRTIRLAARGHLRANEAEAERAGRRRAILGQVCDPLFPSRVGRHGACAHFDVNDTRPADAVRQVLENDEIAAREAARPEIRGAELRHRRVRCELPVELVLPSKVTPADRLGNLAWGRYQDRAALLREALMSGDLVGKRWERV